MVQTFSKVQILHPQRVFLHQSTAESVPERKNRNKLRIWMQNRVSDHRLQVLHTGCVVIRSMCKRQCPGAVGSRLWMGRADPAGRVSLPVSPSPGVCSF